MVWAVGASPHPTKRQSHALSFRPRLAKWRNLCAKFYSLLLRSGKHLLCHFDRGLPSGEIYVPNSTLSCYEAASTRFVISTEACRVEKSMRQILLFFGTFKLNWLAPLQDPSPTAQDDRTVVLGAQRTSNARPYEAATPIHQSFGFVYHRTYVCISSPQVHIITCQRAFLPYPTKRQALTLSFRPRLAEWRNLCAKFYFAFCIYFAIWQSKKDRVKLDPLVLM